MSITMVVGLEEIVSRVWQRPGMFLVNDSVYALGQFMMGVEVAIGYNNGWQDDQTISFMEWVEHKYKICHAGWNWMRILHHVAGSEQKALALFFDIWPDYLANRDLMLGRPRIDYGAPDESVTDQFWAFLEHQQWPTRAS